jgi:hypothetical protein
MIRHALVFKLKHRAESQPELDFLQVYRPRHPHEKR